MFLKVDVYHHIGDDNLSPIIMAINKLDSQLKAILKQGEKIMATTEETVVKLNAVNDKLGKVGTEIEGLKTEIADLKTAVDNAKTTDPAIVEATDRLVNRSQALDDLNIDTEPVV